MKNQYSEKQIIGITVFAVMLFGIFGFASWMSFKSFIDVFNESKINNVLGLNISKYINLTSENNEVTKNEISLNDSQNEYSSDFLYKVATGKTLGQLGASEKYEFYLSWPVIDGLGFVTQCYNENHNGIDIAYYSYPEILATAPGKVIFAGCYSEECPEDGQVSGGEGLARTILIEHDYGFITVYGHLNKIFVEDGQKVSRNEVIGEMGQSGTIQGESGVHLHFSLLKDLSWTTINPSEYLLKEVCVNGKPDVEIVIEGKDYLEDGVIDEKESKDDEDSFDDKGIIEDQNLVEQ